MGTEENMETEGKMDMRQFAEKIRETIEQEQQGRFEEVILQDVLKNNGITRRGLVLRGSGTNLAPAIYLESFFRAYEEGTCMGEIVRRILEAYGSTPHEGVDMSFFQEFPKVKDRLCMRLVNRDANAGHLEDVPYRELLDLAVVYYVDYHDSGFGAGTIQVRNSHMEMWGITEGDLWEAARRNTPQQKPGRIENMEDILVEMCAGEGDGDSGFCSCCMGRNPVPMLVITNTERIYGAAVILYDGILKQAADKTDSDLYILPSSIHEVIAVPMMMGKDASTLREMVIEVNQNEVHPEDVLSGNVYIYRRERDRLEVAR